MARRPKLWRVVAVANGALRLVTTVRWVQLFNARADGFPQGFLATEFIKRFGVASAIASLVLPAIVWFDTDNNAKCHYAFVAVYVTAIYHARHSLQAATGILRFPEENFRYALIVCTRFIGKFLTNIIMVCFAVHIALKSKYSAFVVGLFEILLGGVDQSAIIFAETLMPKYFNH